MTQPDLLPILRVIDFDSDIELKLTLKRIGRERRQSIARKSASTRFENRFEGVRK